MMRNTGMDTKNSLCDMIIPEETCTCRYQRRGRRVEGRAHVPFRQMSYGLAEGWFEFYGSGRLSAQLLRSCVIAYNIRESSTKGAIAFPWLHSTQTL